MRVGVIGTGAIGGTVAALLGEAGHDVCVTARGPQGAAIGTHGLVLEGAWGAHRSRPRRVERMTADRDVVYVCVKAQDADAAIRAQAGQIATARVVLVQNGVTGLRDAAGLLPHATVVGALALFAATIAEPGRVLVTAPGDVWFGSEDADAGFGQAAAEAAFLDAVLPSHAVRDFAGCQWTKLIINQVNAMPAITALSVQETVDHPGLRRIIARGLREAVRVASATGVRFGRIQGLGPGILGIVEHAPVGAAGLLLRAMARRMGAVPNAGSTLQSIRRGRPSEIDFLNGAIVARAREHGRRAPVNAALVGLVHEVERTGRFLSPDEVLRRVPR